MCRRHVDAEALGDRLELAVLGHRWLKLLQALGDSLLSVAKLVAAAVIAVDRPPDVGAAPAAAGLGLAAGTWALTAFASRVHRRLGDPLDSAAHRLLLAVHHARTALWTTHTLLGAIIVAGASRAG